MHKYLTLAAIGLFLSLAATSAGNSESTALAQEAPASRLINDQMWNDYVAALSKTEYWKRLEGLRDAAADETLKTSAVDGFGVKIATDNSVALLLSEQLSVSFGGGKWGNLSTDSEGEYNTYKIFYSIYYEDDRESEGPFVVQPERVLPLSFPVLKDITVIHPLNQPVNLSGENTVSSTVGTLCRNAGVDFVIAADASAKVNLNLRQRSAAQCLSLVCTAANLVVTASGLNSRDLNALQDLHTLAGLANGYISESAITNTFGNRDLLLARREVDAPIATYIDAARHLIRTKSKESAERRVVVHVRPNPIIGTR